MGYINEKSGVTKGPIRIQHEGPWLYNHKEGEQNVLTIFRTVSEEFKNVKSSETIFDDSAATLPNTYADVILKVPNYNTGWKELKDDQGNTIKDNNNNTVYEPVVGWHAVPNIWWIKTYLDNYKDEQGVQVNVTNLIDRNQLIEELELWKVQITKEYMHQINIDRTEIDNLQEVCDNINIGMDTEWILDGGDPTYNLRHTIEWSTVEVKEADRDAELPS